MIAIMILGIGVVMVATVFPVGLEIARQPIQTYLSMAISDTASATLKAKVPPYRELDQAYLNNISAATHRILVPDVDNVEIHSPGTEAPCVINDKEIELFLNLDINYPTMLFPPGSPPNWPSSPGPPISYLDWSTANWSGLPSPLPSGQSVQQFISRTRVLTERTGWSAEVDIANPQNLRGWNTAQVVPSQNLPADLTARAAIPDLNSIPMMVLPSLAGTYPPDLPRISLVDQVYPPISRTICLTLSEGLERLERDYQDRTVVWNGQNVLVPGVRPDLESSRYSWMAFHHRITTEIPQPGKLLTSRDILVSIATLHRADLGARFARQRTLDATGANYQVDFEFGRGVTGAYESYVAALQPKADTDPATDAVFPRPWLVMLADLDAQNARASCSAEVARLLPTGAYFVIARSTSSYAAGTALQVTRSEYNPANLGSTVDPDLDADNFPWEQIEVTRSSLGGATWVPIWVFPPAINNLAAPRQNARLDYEFATRSPIVGVELRSIPIQ